MNRYFLLSVFTAIYCLAYGQKQEYLSNFESAYQIRSYLSSNIETLDPIEGEYDVESSGRHVSPYVNETFYNCNFKAYIVGNSSNFDVYIVGSGSYSSKYLRKITGQGSFGLSHIKMESIGGTNAYRMSFFTSSVRIYLQNNNHLDTKILLNKESEKKFLKEKSYISSLDQITLYNDFIKVYPTNNATRKAIEEAQPKEWTGTGFALYNNYIVTNNHVVDGAKTISIQGINGDFNHKYSAEVVKKDKVNDLAIIKVNGTTIPSASIPYAVKVGTAEVGEEVFVLGYPLTSTMGEEIKLTTGVISSKTGFQGDVSIYQISAPVQPGNSGGPLFDSKGNVIGIVSAKHQGAENVGYAIKTSYLKNLMESAVSTNILPRTNKMAGQNLSGKVKQAQNYVYYITCSSKGDNYPTTKASGTPTIRKTNPTKVDGYRVQVYKGGNTSEDRKEAERIGTLIKEKYPNISVYVHFYNPNWICRVGNYINFSDAKEMAERLKELGLSTIIMKGTITVNTK